MSLVVLDWVDDGIYRDQQISECDHYLWMT
jgi:hypothetical protein